MSSGQAIGVRNKAFDVNGQAIQASWPGQCFGCSRSNRHGLQLRFIPTESGCLTRCEIPNRYCGFDGVVHGGITTTLMDEAAIWAIAVQTGGLGLTVELTVRYHAPVPTDTEVIVEGTLLEHDERTAFTRSTVSSLEGTLLAEAESTWRLTTLSRFSQIMGMPESTLEQFFDALRAEL